MTNSKYFKLFKYASLFIKLANIDKHQAAYILGVGIQATEEEIKKAYKEKALKAHPDHGGSNDKMIELNIAKDVMLNSDNLFDISDKVGLGDKSESGRTVKEIIELIRTIGLAEFEKNYPEDHEFLSDSLDDDEYEKAIYGIGLTSRFRTYSEYDAHFLDEDEFANTDELIIYTGSFDKFIKDIQKIRFERFNQKYPGYISSFVKEYGKDKIFEKVYGFVPDYHSTEPREGPEDIMPSFLRSEEAFIAEVKHLGIKQFERIHPDLLDAYRVAYGDDKFHDLIYAS